MREIEESRELLYVIRSLEILMSSGIGLEAALYSIAKGGHGIISTDFASAMDNVSKGRPLEGEIRRLMSQSKNDGYRRMLNTMLNNIISDTNIVATLQTQGGREEEIRAEKVKKYIEDLSGLPESLLTFGMLGPIILSLVGLFPQLMGDMAVMLGMNMEASVINSIVGGGLIVTLVGMGFVGMRAHLKDPGL